MLEPARLCTTGRPSRSRQAAIIAAVVVLPLVADRSIEPASSSCAMLRIEPGAIRSSIRPGAVVPPVRPLRRLAARTSRARLRAGRYISPVR